MLYRCPSDHQKYKPREQVLQHLRKTSVIIIFFRDCKLQCTCKIIASCSINVIMYVFRRTSFMADLWLRIFPAERKRVFRLQDNPGPRHMPETTAPAITYFYLMFTVNLMRKFVTETNRYIILTFTFFILSHVIILQPFSQDC